MNICRHSEKKAFLRSCEKLFREIDMLSEFHTNFNPRTETFEEEDQKLSYLVNFFVNHRSDNPCGIVEKSDRSVVGFYSGILFVKTRERKSVVDALVEKVLKRLHPDTVILALCRGSARGVRQMAYTAEHCSSFGVLRLIAPENEPMDMSQHLIELTEVAASQVAQMLSAAVAQKLIEEYVADSIGAAHRRALVYDLVAE